MLAALVLAGIVLGCSAVSVLCSWCAWPFEMLQATCKRGLQRLSPTLHRRSPVARDQP
jgi:hypothetical protein